MTNAAHLEPVDLRCESLTDPIGIDRPAPSFSWKLRPVSPSMKNLSQRGYRILVASDPVRLEPDKADLWDSGEVWSSAQYGIPYAGKKLQSGQDCWWKVQVFDEEETESEWSDEARFQIGLLNPADWQARWIAIDAPDSQSSPFKGASWIWSSADTQGSVPKISRTFTKRFNSGSLTSASITLTADDQFTLWVNGKEAGKSDGGTDAWRRPVTLDLKPYLVAGENELKITAENSGAQAGLLAWLVLQPTGGSAVELVTDGTWLDQDGKPAQVLGAFGIAPWGNFGSLVLRSATYYRTEFKIAPKLVRATAYVTALGLVDFHLNGRRINDDLFTPGWTDYDDRVYYRTYDVTKKVQQGQNAVGAVLGDGWYSGYIGYGSRRGHYGDRPRVRVQIVAEYLDGTKEIVATSDTWRASTGPILEQDFLAGEVYDARLAEPNWAKVGFDDSDWIKPYVAPDTGAKLEAFNSQPVKAYERLRAKTIKEIKPGVYLLDYGQNLAGFARLRVRGQPGQKITLRFGEWLNPDGTLYTTNLRAARATDTYICRGGGLEEWEPRFTFHGFQYAEVSGLTSAPTLDDVVAVAISTDTPEVGTFETSDRMLNKLSSNAWWTQKMNFIDIPTDCPQRDERLGWTGDAQAYIRTATMYSDVQAFFTKWLISLDDSQRADGQFPMVVPLKVAEGDGGPAWADAGVICPWTIYDVYGDKRQLAEHYPQMKKFVDFCRDRSTPDLLPPAKFHCFGDWLSINANTPHEVIYEAYFAGSARIVADAAAVLGYSEDAAKYSKLANDVKAAFNKAYVSPDGVVKGSTQCGYVLALGFDLLDGEMAKKAADLLIKDIESRNWHLSTGFVGTRDLMHVLSKIGRNDVAFRLLHNTTFPSWKFEIVNGATSIWERWDGWTPDKGFQDPGMNSFSHYAYGAVMGWVFEKIGGIDNLTPGFEKVLIAPQIDPTLTYANTSYNSVRGLIKCDWRTVSGKLTMNIEIPPNVVAEVRVPVIKDGKVTNDGGLQGRVDGDVQVFSVGSGRYKFEADWIR